MPYNSQTTRANSQALIPEDVSREIIDGVTEQSVVMQLGRRLPNMPRNQRRLPILSSLVTAYFVSGDTGYKQTASEAWTNKYINADELAVIVPIPENVLDDVDYDLWGEIKPRIVEAFGIAFDQAVMYGTNAPNDWPVSILTGSGSGGANFNKSLAAATDLYSAVLGDGGTISKIEGCGFFPSGHVGSLTLRGKLRDVRDADGNLIFNQNTIQASTQYMLDGQPLLFPRNGAVDPAQTLLISGDWTQLVWALRTDISYKILDQAVITDSSGTVQFNLPQQDMVALRATMRLGWQLPNPINRIQATETSRYPFACLIP